MSERGQETTGQSRSADGLDQLPNEHLNSACASHQHELNAPLSGQLHEP